MIGVFDSGIGGLGIFKEIKKLLPKESVFYYADTKNFPYGNKTKKQITQFVRKAIKFLAKRVNIIVLACNTASLTDLKYFRCLTTRPIIATLPAIKPACKLKDKVAVMATPFTIKSKSLDYLSQQFCRRKIRKIACPGLAEAIEARNTKKINELTRKYVPKDVEVIVLGCTHYTLIKNKIKKLTKAQVIDSNKAVARQVKKVMQEKKLFKPQKKAKYIFYSSLLSSN